jgi:hypothetical protein
LDLTAYLHPGWTPLIRPAPATRPWMDATPESFAYRCLPLNIANAHGWEVLTPHGFEAIWDGNPGTEAITIKLADGAEPARAPVSLFGQGVLTFHIEAIMRTPPGWDLWVGGSPNRQKDGIQPLTGVVETDWSPFTFTMNWRFTRPHHWVRFEALEPFCFLFPVQRGAAEAFEPKFEPLGADPDTGARFRAWSEARDAFHAKMQREPPKAPADRWQKHYYRGTDVSGAVLAPDHRAKLRLKSFDRSAAPHVPAPPAEDAPQPVHAPALPAVTVADAEELATLRKALAKREWLLETLERQRAMAPAVAGIPRRENLDPDEFLERYYAVNRPVILVGEMKEWPALSRWTPEYLKAKVGAAPVEYQGGRTGNERFEMEKDRHRRTGPFSEFMDLIGKADGNDAYITAYNSAGNQRALAPLFEDMGYLDKFLTRDQPAARGMMWIGPAGTTTSLHHDLTNNFIGQLVGRKRLQVLPAAEVGKLYNHQHVFSRIADLEDPSLDAAQWPRLPGAHVYEVILEPGEIMFMPLAWWHQVKSLDFSVTVTWTNFRWPNDGYATYPQG